MLDAGCSMLENGLWVLETNWYTWSPIRTVFVNIANYEGLEGSIIDNSVANSRIDVRSKNMKKTIDCQPQNHCTQDKGKYHLIGTELLHHIGLRDIRLRISDCGFRIEKK
jgi:hypothetical protein